MAVPEQQAVHRTDMGEAVEAALAKPAESYACFVHPAATRSSSSGDVDARRQPCLIRTSDDLLELTRTWEDEDVSTMLLDEKLEADDVHRATRLRRVEAALGRRGRDRCRPPLGLRGRPSANEAPDVSDSYPPTPRSTRRSSIAEGLSKVFLSIWPRINTGPWAPRPRRLRHPTGDMGATPNSGTEADPDDATGAESRTQTRRRPR